MVKLTIKTINMNKTANAGGTNVENWEQPLKDFCKALFRITDNEFVILLDHIKRYVIPASHPQCSDIREQTPGEDAVEDDAQRCSICDSIMKQTQQHTSMQSAHYKCDECGKVDIFP